MANAIRVGEHLAETAAVAPAVATRAETNVVYVAGLVQGIVLVTFPAASTIFTDPDEYDLSRSQYGAMFLPQVITAIAGALLGSGLASRFGAKRVYLVGLAASLVAMGLLVTSTLFTDDQPVAYGLLLTGDGLPGRGIRAHRPNPQHVHGGVPPEGDRSVGAGAQRPARARHRPGPAVRGHLRRSRLLVGSPGALVGAARRAAPRQLPAASADRRSAPPGRRVGIAQPGSRPASGGTQCSRCSTASARP